MWNLRNLTEDHGGREGEKNSFKQRGRQTHKALLNTENKLRVDGEVGEREWVMGIEEGTCWGEHWVLYVSDEPPLKPRAHYTLYVS